MANQSIGSPRFFIDFTQLAKLKGFFYWEDGVQNVNKISPNSDESNNNIWNFDLYKVQTYNSLEDSPDFYFYLNNDKAFSRLISSCNWAGFFNHNFASSFDDAVSLRFGIKDLENNTTSVSIDDTGDQSSNVQAFNNGYSIGTFDELGTDDVQMVFLGLRNANEGSFSVGCGSFGRYYDMPNAPDLNIKKSVEYDGVNIQRTLGGADYVQVNNSGTPNWISGEPFALIHPDESSSRIGRHGRRSWKMSFSYIANDNLFYDTGRPNVFGDLSSEQGSDYNSLSAGSEVQQIFDLTLGGALSFIFCPDPSATNPEFAQCRLDQESLLATQVAHQTWNISMNIIEVW